MIVDFTRGSIEDLVVTTECLFPVTLWPSVDEARDLGYSILDAGGDRMRHGDLAETRTEWLPSGTYHLSVGPDREHTREIPFTIESGRLVIPVEP